jgi:hypothetical protein
MKWLQDNPLGMVLAAISGVFLLLVLGMAIVWTLPVKAVGAAVTENESTTGSDAVLASREMSSLSEYRVINDRPVFNESRHPVDEEVNDELLAGDPSFEIRDAPDVRLTGVVITPAMKIASLTPADGKLETVMAYEGESLTGEFVGWQVTSVSPRTVVLESRDGQKLELELQVHDVKIKEPPKPAEHSKTAQAGAGRGAKAGGEDEPPLTRAEQIRQRIADRREELRREQEENQGTDQGQSQRRSRQASTKSTASQAPGPNAYQNAIQTMMKKSTRKEPVNDDDEDQGNNDNDG